MSLLSDVAIPGAVTSARQVRHDLRQILANAVDTVKQVHTQLWMQDGVDTQDIFDLFTTNGAAFMSARDSTVAFITAIAEANDQTVADYIDPMWYEPPAGKDLQVNVDGSITVIDV